MEDDVKQLLLGFQGQIAALTQQLAAKDEQNRVLMEMVVRIGGREVAPAVVVVPASDSGPTFNEMWPEYVRSESHKLESWKTIEGRARRHVLRILGKRRVMATTLETIRYYRGIRKDEFTVRKMLTTPATRNREVELIRRMCSWGDEAKAIPSDPLHGVKREDLFEDEKNIRRNVIEDDPNDAMSIEDLLRYGDELDQALVLVAHSSGMRRKEIAVFETAWLDLRPGADGKPLRIVEIPPGVAKGRKGKKLGRQTFISPAALEALKRYRATLPFDLQRRSTWLFVNATMHREGKRGKHYGQHLHPDTLTKKFTELQARAGLTGPSGPPWLHDLRRSFITLARRRGEDTSNIMEASGHTTMKAFQRYDIHARKDAIVVRDRIDHAREKELAGLATQERLSAEARKGPQRVQGAESAPNPSQEKNKRG